MSNQTSIRILHQNLRHSPTPTKALALNAKLLKADILCLQEVHPISNTEFSKVTGYPEAFCAPENPRCAIQTTRSDILLLAQFTTPTCTCVEVNVRRRPFILCCVYYSHSGNLEGELAQLQTIIDKYHDRSVVITGDMNGWHTAWGSAENNHRGEQIYDFFCANGFLPMNVGTSPTYAPTQSPTIRTRIDVTFVNEKAHEFACHWEVMKYATLSDHQLISFRWEAPSKEPFKSVTRKYRTKNIRWENFLSLAENELRDFDRRAPLLNSEGDIDQFVTSFTNSVQAVCEKTLPATKPSNEEIFWLTPEIAAMNKRVNNLRNRYQRQRNTAERLFWKEQYYEAVESFAELIKATKPKFCREFYSNINKDTMWNNYRMFGTSSRLNHNLSTVKTDSGHTKDVNETGPCLMEHFFPDDPGDDAFSLRIRELSRSIYSEPDDPDFTKEEVESSIMGEDDKSPGHDAISANIIKQIHKIFPNLFYNLYNKCLQFGVFPSTWKISVVKVIPKPSTSDRQSIKSFRPISLLPVMGKILEKLENDRLTFLLHSIPNGISHHQFGFTPQVSAEDAINEIVRRQRAILESKGKKFGIYISLDISAAFDSAWWEMILVLLRKNKCPGNLYRLISHYFTNRKARLPLCGKVFHKDLSRGCPQGAKTSPLLWNLLYSSLMQLELPEGCYLQAFADDGFLAVEGDNEFECQFKANTALQMIAAWGDKFKLNFNPSKTKAMLVTRRHEANYVKPLVFMKGVPLAYDNSIKYLGVVLDQKLLWEEHTDYICKKALDVFLKIARTTGKKWGLSGEVLKIIYECAIEPIFAYSCSAWASEVLRKPTYCTKLRRAQRGFALLITRAYRTVSTEAAVLLANILPLDLKIQLWNERYHIKHGTPLNHFLEGLEYQKPAHFLESGHPAFRKKYVHDHCDEVHQHSIYTDGSKMEGQTGCAFVVYSGNRKGDHRQYRLQNFCSVFQAELLAIKEAVTWCAESGASAIIYSDSQSALDAITDWTNRNQLVVDIRKQLTNHQHHVCLRWVKAHVGIEGNEEADTLAKDARVLPDIVYDKYPLSFAMREVNARLHDTWNERWVDTRNGPKHLGTKHFFPTVADRLKCSFIPDYQMTRMLTGHDGFNAYKIRFGIPTEETMCECEEQHQTAVHYIEKCPRTAARWNEYSATMELAWDSPDFGPKSYCQDRCYNIFHNYILKILTFLNRL